MLRFFFLNQNNILSLEDISIWHAHSLGKEQVAVSMNCHSIWGHELIEKVC